MTDMTIIVGFLVTIAVAVIGTRQKGLSDLTQFLQAEIKALRETATEDRARIVVLETVGRVKDEYIDTLREHINEQLPPPPPPFPSGL